MSLVQSIIAVFLVSLVSFSGLLAFGMQRLFDRYVHLLVAFAAGTLVATALLSLLPEGVEQGGEGVYVFALLGILTFFIVERLLYWYHCRHGECDANSRKEYTYLNLIGDGIHNFLDGAIIAASFSVNVALGITSTVAIVLHEIPQELGDFAILVQGGFTKARALFFNFLSALTAFGGVFVAWYFIDAFEFIESLALGFSAGAFLYIALADLLPELHHRPMWVKSLAQMVFFMAGTAVVLVLGVALPH